MKLPALAPALTQRAAALALAAALGAGVPSLPVLALDAVAPSSIASEAELKAMSQRNVKLPTGGSAERIFQAGVELASKAQDPDTQTRDVAMLRRGGKRR